MLARFWKFYVDSFSGLSKEVWTLAVVILINRAGMMVLPFLALYCTRELGFSIVQAGIVTGMYGAGSLFGSLLGGWLTDKVGFYKVLTFSLFLGAIGMASLSLYTSFYALSVAVLLTSTIVDASRPPVMAGIAYFSEPENQTRAVSLIRMALNLGISIGPAVAGFLSASAGYNWLFILDGLTCALAGLYLVLQIEPGSRGKPKIQEEEIDSDRKITNDYLYFIFLFVAGINIIAFMQILSSIPLFFNESLGLDETQIGLFFTFNGLLVFVFEMPLVAYSQRRWSPFQSMILGGLLMGLGHLFLNLPLHWLIVIMGYNILISFGEIINFPFGNSLAMSRAPMHQKGKYMGLWATMFSLTFIIAPILGTQLIDQVGFYYTWVVMALLNFITIPGLKMVQKYWTD